MRQIPKTWLPLVKPTILARRISAHPIVSGRLLTTLSIGTPALLILGLICVWVSMVLLANPIGEFPLNDDWSYGRTVQTLVEHGRLEFSGFTSMPLVAQVLWGALFCLPFGFSFMALRVSTMTLGALGVFATFKLFHEIKADRAMALLGAMVVAMNPLYFQLSLSFMTDVPFFTFSMFSFLFLLRALDTQNRVHLFAGYVFSGAAILTRQLGVIIPLSFAIAYFAKNGLGRKTFQNALVPAGILVALLFAYPIMLQWTVGLPALYNRSFEPIAESASMNLLQVPWILADRFLVQWVYLGLFLLPFSIPILMNAWQKFSPQSRRLFAFTGLALFAAGTGVLLWQGRTMPLIGNVLFDLGLGPTLMRDTYLLRLRHWPTAPRQFWLVVTAAGVLGSILLIRRLLMVVGQMIKLPKFRWEVEKPWTIFVLLACVSYCVLIGITGFLDRYLIFLLPLLMMLLLATRDSHSSHIQVLPFSIAVVFVLFYGLFALGGTHDYLAWNRARWQALNDLEQQHIAYKSIDGGFEFNGWYGYDPKYHEHPPQSWWWVQKDDYMISFGPVNGYSELRRYPFERWILSGQSDVFVLHRVAESENVEQ